MLSNIIIKNTEKKISIKICDSEEKCILKSELNKTNNPIEDKEKLFSELKIIIEKLDLL